MGEFTIYDWGNGAAAEAANRILDRYGHVYLDRRRNQAFNVDTVRVRPVGRDWEIVNLDDTPRLLRAWRSTNRRGGDW
jgi:hypothetical protein